MIDSFTGKHRFLSNFYLRRVTYKLLSYRSTEHAYQCAKGADRDQRRSIRRAVTPAAAKRLGQRITLHPDWDKIKLEVMHAIVSTKFKQHPDLRQRLLDTGDQQLVEGNWWQDRYWGVCDGEGENHLGRILMEVRKELQ